MPAAGHKAAEPGLPSFWLLSHVKDLEFQNFLNDEIHS